MASAASQTALHHDGQFAIRLAPTQTVNPEASTWLATEEPAPQRSNTPARAVPQHPIPAMQEAFAESLEEVATGTLSQKPKLRTGDARARRDMLLDQDKAEGPPCPLWRYRPGQKCHEVRKLLAQISFGVYLLLNGMANSNAQVVSILQGHIDEVDEFLEVNMEDFNLAIEDLTKRLELLKLPMENLQVFEQMLEDRQFRLQIVDGNLKIEHILARTTTALVQSVQDINEGLKSTKEFTEYLSAQQDAAWRKARPDVIDIFEAMRGNTGGWLNAFVVLQGKSNSLNALINKLTTTVAAMDKKAGEVSRRTRFSVEPFSNQMSPTSNMASSEARSPPQSPQRRMSGGSDTSAGPRDSQYSITSSLVRESQYSVTSSSHPRDSQYSIQSSTSTARPESQYSTTSSQATVTPPASPKVALAPPRLSLRFSSVDRPEYFDIPIKRDTVIFNGNGDSDKILVTEDTSAANTPTIKVDDPFSDANAVNPEVKVATQSPPRSGPAQKIEPEPRIQYQASSPPRLKPALVMIPGNKKASPKEPELPPSPAVPKPSEDLYLLQPRTYTPVPPAPLPSPRIVEEVKTVVPEPAQPKGLFYDAPEAVLAPALQEKSSRRNLRPANPEASPQRPTPPQRLGSDDSGPPSARLLQQRQQALRQLSREDVRPNPTDARKSDASDGTKPTSLRERVSQKSTPPTSIQIPAPDAPVLQKPVFHSPSTYQNYQTFTGPPAEISTEKEVRQHSLPRPQQRIPAPHAQAAMRSSSSGLIVAHPPRTGSGQSGSDLSPPVFPGLIPSPHSDQQHFRPVRASPHSPLQQRPHTAGYGAVPPGHNNPYGGSMRGYSTLR